MRGPRAAVPPRRGEECRYQEGAHEAPGRRGAPGVPGTTRAAIQLPPLSPSAPVRTQVFPPGRPSGRGRAAAYGPRVEGPDPVDNAGERRIPRGGSPQESGVRRGQRPSIHRLHRCRGRRGPRASGAATTAPPGVNPGGARRRRRRSSIGGGVGHEVTQGTSPGEGIVQAGKGPLHPTDAGQRGTTTRRGGRRGDCVCRALSHVYTYAVGSGERHCTRPLHIPSDLCW